MITHKNETQLTPEIFQAHDPLLKKKVSSF